MAPTVEMSRCAIEVRHVHEGRAWDDLVLSFEDHDLHQGFDWGELSRGQGWIPVRLAVMEGDECVAVMSVLTWTVPGLGLSVMYVPRGPLLREGAKPTAVAALVEEVRRVARQETAVFLRVSPGRVDEEGALGEVLAAHGFRRLPEECTVWNSPRIVMRLPLSGGEQAVRARMRKSTRRHLTAAAEGGVVIRDGGTREDFQELHHLITLNARRKKVPARSSEYFERLSMFVRAGVGKLSFAELNGIKVAGQFGVRFGQTAHFLYYGVDPRFLHLQTARALDWEHIKWALSERCSNVDLGGSATGFPPRETDQGYGVYQYKAGLGCEIRRLTAYYDLVFRPLIYRALRVIERHQLPMAWKIRARFPAVEPDHPRRTGSPRPAPKTATPRAGTAGQLVVREVWDREEWNALVLGLPSYDLRQGFEWGEVRASQGWRPRRLAVFQGESCVGAFSLLAKSLPLLGSSVLYVSAGPLLADAGSEPVWEQILEAIRAIGAETRAVFVRFSPKVSDKDAALRETLVAHGFRPLPDDWTTWNSPRICMAMDLREPEEALSRKLRRRYREYITSAPRRGVTVKTAVSLEEGRQFHAALAAAGRRKGLPVRGRDYFEWLWKQYLRQGQGILLLAEHHGEPVGGLLGVKLGQKAYMLYVTLRDRSAGQGPLLYWEFIRWAKQGGCTSIDWGGVGTNFPPREDDPGFGLYHFKLGFNSSLEYHTGYYDLVFSPVRYGVFRFLERWVFAVAWKARAQMNGRFLQVRNLVHTARRKTLQFWISLGFRGIGGSLRFAARAFLRPNHFVVLTRNLSASGVNRASPEATTWEMWDAGTVRAWRRDRHGVPPAFFRDAIDGVDTCAVALVQGEVAGLIWIYRPGDVSRLFHLRESEAELNYGHVLLPYRGMGVFRELLSFSCLRLREQGYRTVYAMVESGNEPSLRAFRSAGFREISSVRHFLVFRPKFENTSKGSKALAGPAGERT